MSISGRSLAKRGFIRPPASSSLYARRADTSARGQGPSAAKCGQKSRVLLGRSTLDQIGGVIRGENTQPGAAFFLRHRKNKLDWVSHLHRSPSTAIGRFGQTLRATV